MNGTMDRIGEVGLVPVVVLEKVEDANNTALALKNGGVPVMEITLRTAAGLDAIYEVKSTFPDMIVGAGTVLSLEHAQKAVKAGAEFIVSPGLNHNVVQWCIDNVIPVIPGCVTPTEIAKALSYGLNTVKFFPADIYGGIKGCTALYGPYKDITFIPTGGINLSNLNDYADKSYIHAIGGSWFCSRENIETKNFLAITETVKKSIRILLGFEIAHIGINAENEQIAVQIANEFSDAFGMDVKPGNSSVFAGSCIEVIKERKADQERHIAIRTNSIKRAVYYLSQNGYEADINTLNIKNGKTTSIYLKKRFAGFAVHLLQK
jgi:2-dehydro-3-deoxyphosphogluconate aldolase/(4S)-4-hydroxy-2-oxoglutarate aldolase